MSFRISVSVHGIDELRRKYRASAIQNASQAGLGAALLQMEAEAKDSATRIIYARPETGYRRTGAYRASLGTGGGGNVRRLRPGYAAFGSRLSYAQIIEKGSRPHVIRPRTKKALAFTGRGGQRVVVRSVNHPGTRARHVLKTAARTGKGRIVGAYQRQFWRSLGR